MLRKRVTQLLKLWSLQEPFSRLRFLLPRKVRFTLQFTLFHCQREHTTKRSKITIGGWTFHTVRFTCLYKRAKHVRCDGRHFHSCEEFIQTLQLILRAKLTSHFSFGLVVR